MDCSEQRGVRAYECRALLAHERALHVAAFLHLPVGVAHRQRALLGGLRHAGGGHRVDVRVERRERIGKRRLVARLATLDVAVHAPPLDLEPRRAGTSATRAGDT